MTLRHATIVLTIAIMVTLAGCGGQTRTVQQPDAAASERVYFPPAPLPPRLQFLTSLAHAGALSDGKSRRDGSFATWVAGNEPTADAPTRLEIPYGIDAHKGKIYVCDTGRNCIHVINAANGKSGLMGSPNVMKNPVNVTIDDRDGTKYVCDTGKGMILVFDNSDNYVREFGDPQGLKPMDLVIDGDNLIVVDGGGEIEFWSKSGQRLRTIGRYGQGPDHLNGPSNLALDARGRIYVSDTLAQQVKIFDQQGNFQGSIGEPGTSVGSFARPKGIAIDPHGHIYVTDAQWGVVQIFNREDQVLLVVSGMRGQAPGIVVPAAIALDATSVSAFSKYIDPDFEAEYLVFLVNQYGRRKVSIYAYGRSKSRPTSDYETAEATP